ncbi:protein of unknown function (plasmid) [Shinella sp. WSC3-e]|nr:hypothetical protein SHINE37_60038 [Rhizobiaceae bacterium]CAK7262113.1 protein of unknown function [Shinella sp. WSC3-e]
MAICGHPFLSPSNSADDEGIVRSLYVEYGGAAFDKVMAERADLIPPAHWARNSYTSQKRRFRGGAALTLVKV